MKLKSVVLGIGLLFGIFGMSVAGDDIAATSEIWRHDWNSSLDAGGESESSESWILTAGVRQPAGEWRGRERIERPTAVISEEENTVGWLDGLEIGLRTTQLKLEKEKGDFLGSIDYHKVEQEPIPEPFVRYWITKHVGLDLSRNQVETETVTTYAENKNDGNILMKGPGLMAVLALPLKIPVARRQIQIRPAVSVGIGKYDGGFKEEDFWRYGFRRPTDADYIAWVNAGKPAHPNNDYTRKMIVSDSDATLLQGEVEIIWGRWIFGAYLRKMNLKIDHSFRCYSHGRTIRGLGEDTEQDLSNTSSGVELGFGF